MKIKKSGVVFVIIVVLTGGGLWLGAKPVWQGICGNSPISFYGQVIDADGKPSEGVEITFHILYSDKLPLSQIENHLSKTVTADVNGNFSLTDIYGYSVRIEAVKLKGIALGLKALNLKAEDDPGYGVTMGERISRGRLPANPSKRVIYHLVNL